MINVKRIAYAVRTPEDAFEKPAVVSRDRGTVVAAVERYLAGRGVLSKPEAPDVVSSVVDRFLSAKKGEVGGSGGPGRSPAQFSAGDPPAPQQQPPPPPIVDFVCESDVRDAMRAQRKIYVGPKTIITPSAREFGDQFGILVLAQR